MVWLPSGCHANAHILYFCSWETETAVLPALHGQMQISPFVDVAAIKLPHGENWTIEKGACILSLLKENNFS